jgi:hypothetical protein
MNTGQPAQDWTRVSLWPATHTPDRRPRRSTGRHLACQTAPVNIEGTVDVGGFKTWYGIVGEREEPGRLPLLVVHGGPGLPHDYLEPRSTAADRHETRVAVFREDHTQQPSCSHLPNASHDALICFVQVARMKGAGGPRLK